MRNFIISLCALIIFSTPLYAQVSQVSISGTVRIESDRSPLPYANIVLFKGLDSTFVIGTVSNEQGFFTLTGVNPGKYTLRITSVGFETKLIPLQVGRLSAFLDLGTFYMSEIATILGEVTVRATRDAIEEQLDKKSYSLQDNISQLGGSVLQAMQNLPGVTIDRDGKIFLRGSDKVAILLDGKQTAITGIGAQSGLDNIPASAIERIEIITNPSSRFDASGNAGVINIIFRKESDEGFNGRAGFIYGMGGITEKRNNLPNMRDQYRFTPKINPSLSGNYKKGDLNVFVQTDLLWHKQMMKSELMDRVFVSGEGVTQQYQENRTQPIFNFKAGADWNLNSSNTLSFSTLFNHREYTDLGDIPYLNTLTREQTRFWKYYENEVNQTFFATLGHTYSFIQPGHKLSSSLNYSYRHKDEEFYFDNILPTLVGTDTTGLIADEHIWDLTIDYTRPLRSGRMEMGTKQRSRIFPNEIFFNPGLNSILDPGLDGTAEYQELLSAGYVNLVYERNKFELEGGLRVEYVNVDYLVDSEHSVYKSDGFNYLDLFPSIRASHLIDDKSRISAYYNRRVDRPEESALRVFPTYANPEILVLGNPGLEPQFTQSFELGYRRSWTDGYISGVAYHRIIDQTITRILSPVPGSTRLSSVSQNADQSLNTGLEWVLSQEFGLLNFNASANLYQNRISGFTVVNAYPYNISYSRGEESNYTGNVKLNGLLKVKSNLDIQITGIYLAADIIPQGKIYPRYSLDAALTWKIQGGDGEVFVNASDLFNSLVMEQEIDGIGFKIRSKDYYETQVIRLGYQYRF
jgi:outer membrane receptor protein involved in Fe transport